MAKISILVAVYNSANYLAECLDSLLSQTMGDFQVICIDDASQDESLQILESYARRDARFEVISLSKNHGQAYARNQGLERVLGTYTCFLDSDDWLGADALQQVVTTFEKDETIDCVLFRCRYHYPNNRIEDYPMPDSIMLSGEQAFEESLTWKIHGVYAVKTSIHKLFPYDASSKAYSDDNATRLHYLASRKVTSCMGEYFYRQHEESVTHQVTARRFDYLKANANMMETLRKLNTSQRLLTIYENERWKNIVGVYLFYWQHGHELKKSERNDGLRLIRNSWKSIDFDMVYPENKYKWGFMPFRNSRFLNEKIAWFMFRLQANTYFQVKKLLGKM